MALTASSNATKRMIDAYVEMAPATMFLSGFFQTPPVNFHDSEEVELDIERDDEDISVVINDLSLGYRSNENSIYTTKAFKPPVYKEQVPMNAFSLIKREPGQHPFESPNFQANAITRAFKAFRKIEAKIRRSIELQAAQILQTANLTLTDSNGTALYTLDYQPKSSHFPTSAIAWGAVGADPIGDISALGTTIRTDGKVSPDILVFGIDAWENFISDPNVQTRLDIRRINVGDIGPARPRGEGATFRGTAEIGHYSYQLWTYDGRYKDPATGNSLAYMDPDKVVVMSSASRLDATFGSIPTFEGPSQNVLRFLPSRISNVAGGMDIQPNAWITEDKESLFVSVRSRPLLIPTAIDTYGCLDTTP